MVEWQGWAQILNEKGVLRDGRGRKLEAIGEVFSGREGQMWSQSLAVLTSVTFRGWQGLARIGMLDEHWIQREDE